MDYEHVLKLRQMDPGKAEIYKKECRENYQKKRVADNVKFLQDEYVENCEKDPERQSVYAQRFRQSFLEIAGIENAAEFKEMYHQIKEQADNLDVVDQQLRHLTASTADMPPEMQDLSSDEPMFVEQQKPEEVVSEMETTAEVDARLETPATEDSSATEEVKAGEPIAQEVMDIETLRNKYTEVTGKQPSNIYKNNAERLQKKIDEQKII